MLEDAVGIFTGIAGVLAALLTFIVSVWKIREERAQLKAQFTSQEKQWLAKFETERQEWAGERRVSLKSGILQERIRRRYESYPEVLTALGAVRDIPNPAGKY